MVISAKANNGRARLGRIGGIIARYAIAILMCLIILVPILILIIASFKDNKEFLRTPLFQFPKEWTLANYQKVLRQGNFLIGFRNISVIIIATCVINIFLGSLQSYALGRFEFHGKKLILALIMGARVIPTVTTQVATFTIVRKLGLFNTLGAPIILYVGTDVVQTLLYIQFVQRIHPSLDESALIDGASYFRIFWSIIFPLLKPATVTIVILKIIGCYNDMYIPYLYMPSSDLQVVSTAIMKFCSTNYGSVYPVLAAVFIVVMLPMLILYIVAQRQLFSGILAGSVKE